MRPSLSGSAAAGVSPNSTFLPSEKVPPFRTALVYLLCMGGARGGVLVEGRSEPSRYMDNCIDRLIERESPVVGGYRAVSNDH